MSTTFRLQRTLLAACIILAPLSITLYILAWPENPAPVVVNTTTPAPIVTSATIEQCEVGFAAGDEFVPT